MDLPAHRREVASEAGVRSRCVVVIVAASWDAAPLDE
jgi:hypothetical protein